MVEIIPKKILCEQTLLEREIGPAPLEREIGPEPEIVTPVGEDAAVNERVLKSDRRSCLSHHWHVSEKGLGGKVLLLWKRLQNRELDQLAIICT